MMTELTYTWCLMVYFTCALRFYVLKFLYLIYNVIVGARVERFQVCFKV